MSPFRLAKAYVVKRRMIKALWRALDFDGDTKYMNTSELQTAYTGPSVALGIIKHEMDLRKHYRYIDSVPPLTPRVAA